MLYKITDFTHKSVVWDVFYVPKNKYLLDMFSNDMFKDSAFYGGQMFDALVIL